MADAAVLKTVGGNPVRVRLPSSAPAVDYGNSLIATEHFVMDKMIRVVDLMSRKHIDHA